MEIPLMLPTNLYGWISIFTAIIVGVLFIRRNDIKNIKENADELRKEVADKQRLIADLQIQLNSLREELAKLRGILEEKDKRIDALSKVQITQHLNPEVVSYMADMRNFTSQVHTYMIDTSKILGELHAKK